jgi:hypothetical protein
MEGILTKNRQKLAVVGTLLIATVISGLLAFVLLSDVAAKNARGVFIVLLFLTGAGVAQSFFPFQNLVSHSRKFSVVRTAGLLFCAVVVMVVVWMICKLVWSL